MAIIYLGMILVKIWLLKNRRTAEKLLSTMVCEVSSLTFDLAFGSVGRKKAPLALAAPSPALLKMLVDSTFEGVFLLKKL